MGIRVCRQCSAGGARAALTRDVRNPGTAPTRLRGWSFSAQSSTFGCAVMSGFGGKHSRPVSAVRISITMCVANAYCLRSPPAPRIRQVLLKTTARPAVAGRVTRRQQGQGCSKPGAPDQKHELRGRCCRQAVGHPDGSPTCPRAATMIIAQLKHRSRSTHAWQFPFGKSLEERLAGNGKRAVNEQG